MNMRDILPWSRSRNLPSGREEGSSDPFLSLHREVNRLFDDAFRGVSGMPAFSSAGPWPQLEVVDSEKSIRITAEIPGIDEKDVELTLRDGLLTIRGEKREEKTDEARSYSERYYGRFERQIPLGGEIDADKVEATFHNGVLTVTLPKIEDARTRSRRIPIAGTSRH